MAMAFGVVAATAFLGGLAVGRLFQPPPAPPASDDEEPGTPHHTELHLGGLPFINPLLDCADAMESVEIRELKPFKQKVQALVDERRAHGTASAISVYFRDLNNGPWFGVGVSEKFSPASLLKVPLMIALFKEAESNPGLLGSTLTWDGAQDLNRHEHYQPSKPLTPGSHSVEELVGLTITRSDNNAYMLLLNNFEQAKLIGVYRDLSMDVPYDFMGEDIISAKAYASFFRVLFNASYLSRAMSAKALELLSQTEFNEGLVAGVPPGIGIVHKFGERTLGKEGEIKQLHDCGIVYYPMHPYLLCVMTRGRSFDELAGTLREVSRLAFNEVDRQFQKPPGDSPPY